jgi:CheY-like chemotaxis protein
VQNNLRKKQWPTLTDKMVFIPLIPSVLSPTILIADDDEDEVLFIKHQFRTSKILNPIQVVSNGEKVIQYLEGDGIYKDRLQYPYPVVLLLDLKMPIKGGLEILAWLNSHPKHASLPVIVLTVSNGVREVDKAYKLGARSFLTKPIGFSDFTNTMYGVRGIAVNVRKNGLSLERAETNGGDTVCG